MANLVKTKRFGILGAIVLLTISLFVHKNKSDMPKRYKQWTPDSTLYTHDFLHAAPWFGRKYGAAITASIKIIWADSVPQAIVLMDRMRSWYDEGNPPEVLTHEKYHANLFSVYAKRLNQKIAEASLSAEEAYRLQPEYYEEALKMQARYDAETDHGLHTAYQHYWEYTIDSMYNHGRFPEEPEIFSGAHFYYPSKPETAIAQDTFLLKKSFTLRRYGMSLNLAVHYDSHRDTSEVRKTYADFFENEMLKVSKLHTFSQDGRFELHAEAVDTRDNWINCYKSVIDGPHEYLLTAVYPSDEMDSYLYDRMKRNFFNSFKISDTKNFWIRQLKKEGVAKKPVRKSFWRLEDTAKEGVVLTSLSYSDNSLFYHRPFVSDDTLIIAFKPARHSFDDLKEVLVMVNDTTSFSQPPDSVYQILSIPLSELPKGKNKLQFGYLAKSDSIRSSYHFYSSLAMFEN